MKTIPLTQGKSTIVDYAALSQFKWHFTAQGYAARRKMFPDGIKRIVLMHREITEAKPKSITDHINGGKLDNRKSNLRFCTKAQNGQNSKLRPRNNAGLKGAYFNKRRCKFFSSIQANGISKYLGNFPTAEAAHSAYCAAAKVLHGEFARFN